MLLDYPIDQRQAKPRALADFLCGEKWLEYILPGLVVHAHTRVGYLQDGMKACGFKQINFSITAINIDHTRLYGQMSSMRHRVTRIGDKVQQNQFNLSGVYHNLKLSVDKHDFQLYVFSNDPHKHTINFSDYVIEI